MRTLNDITPPSRRQADSLSSPVSRAPLNLSERPSKFPLTTVLVVLGIIAVSIGALFYFSTAQVQVTPNTISAAVQSSFSATPGTGALSYQIVTAQKTATQSVKGSGTKVVSSAASGTITIYNTQTKSQRLITNTRFATAAGLIFRIHTAVTIPGGSSTKPGSISAKVYADQPGSPYNVAATSFTIPGFAGTPQATAVYARSASAMSGGASGTVPVIDTTLEAQTRDALVKALTPDLLASIKGQVPEGYLLLAGSSATTYDALESTPSSATGMVDVKEQGTITAVVFPNAALAKAVAASVTGLGYQNEPVMLTPASTLTLATPALPGADATSFTFTLSGTASLLYTVDPTRIAAAVSGKTRQAAEVALTSYPEVKRAVIILRPFWRQTFPQDPSTVTVVVANP